MSRSWKGSANRWLIPSLSYQTMRSLRKSAILEPIRTAKQSAFALCFERFLTKQKL